MLTERKMNRELKGQIVKIFGSQGDFACAVKKSEPLVSQIIHGRRRLPDEEKKVWAQLLGAATVEELFGDESNA